MASRVHYDSKTCPYAQRSWITLLEKGLPFEIRLVDLNDKDEEFVKRYHSINPDQAAPAKVPILIEPDGTQLIESLVICEYLEQRYPQVPLLPADAVQAAKVRLFVDAFSAQLTPALFGLLRAADAEAVAAGKAKLESALKVLDAFLTQHGSQEGGDYFLGPTYSLAEVATVGFVQRSLSALPAFRGVDLWELVRQNKLGRLERWMEASLARPSAQQTRPDEEVTVNGWRKFVTPLAN
ncbi:hypothetical protein CHLNCDRAFT_135021 [Chlorella variabilis]|uniref:GST N-terminal domain-containing protein n=1 Tax=Chlorella variabilis TaxID=554065 RepID=E1ZHD6_CHLVA|nr:hypothetical protein CHLNCDRAFT_135021 [Chlorella variabilis]EFN54900.1 hypothetical protein CHLNCDRAFT_135021 [Chlorella variabilis]|eukprot:XP_005847002.1 hypothetical protein CHLNCDRAFT_135021 [Chlorella variabilis]